MIQARSIALLTLLSTFSLLFLSSSSVARPGPITFSGPLPPRWPNRDVTVRHYSLKVTTETIWQGCSPFGPTPLINSSLPGPTIRARVGEVLQVRVHNALDPKEGVAGGNLTMHFHGLDMRMHPVMDGTMMISQWPIQPGNFFDYRIPLNPEDKGTYFLHSHVGVQAMTAYAVLIIEDPEEWDVWDPSESTEQWNDDPHSITFKHVWGEDGLNKNGKSGKLSPYHYDEDRVLAISDWFDYSSPAQVEKQLSSDPFVWPGSANRLLLNGKSTPASDSPATLAGACNQTAATLIGVSCSSAPPQCSTQQNYPTIKLDYGKTYRLRFVGAQTLMYTSAAILRPTQTPYVDSTGVQMETMTLIEADGSYIDAHDTQTVEFATGQRYSTLYTSRTQQQVQADGTNGVYWMRVESRWRSGPSMWVQILYPSANAASAAPPVAASAKTAQLLPKETFGWEAASLGALSKSGGPSWWYAEQMPRDDQVTRTVVLDTQQVKFYANGKGVRWAQNGDVYNETDPTNTPYLVRTFLGDVPFPSSSQYSGALDPTTYMTDTGVQGIIGNDPAEIAAARARKWGQGYDKDLNMYFARTGEVIDIVIVNRPSELSAAVEIHPWHMHSHRHWTRSIQPGTFNFTSLNQLYSSSPSSPPAGFLAGYASPIQRDTTVVYASPGAAYLNQNINNPSVNDGGFAVLRYKVDAKNAGFFLLHCHIGFHLYMGMATVWAIAPEKLAESSGIYWPVGTEAANYGVKNPGWSADKSNVEGLALDYLKFDKTVEAVV